MLVFQGAPADIETRTFAYCILIGAKISIIKEMYTKENTAVKRSATLQRDVNDFGGK